MSIDLIRYDLLVQDALRGVVRRVLGDVARDGLPGEHHLYIVFDTRAPGVRLSSRLKAQHPETMTIVLQHTFWDLIVTEQYFEVGLSFDRVAERLHVPFDALKEFFDPSVRFGLQFEPPAEEFATAELQEVSEPEAEAPSRPKPTSVPSTAARASDRREAAKPAEAAGPKRVESNPPAAAPDAKPSRGERRKPADADAAPEDAPAGGAQVVRLDSFRKK